MKVEVEGKVVAGLIAKAGLVAGKMETINLEADKKTGLWIAASGNDSTIRIRVADPEKVAKSGSITVHTSMIVGVLRNRASILLTSKGNQLEFDAVSGKYHGELVLTPYQEMPAAEAASEKKDLKFTKDLQALLDTALEKVSINNVFNDEPIYLWMQSNDKGTTLVCGDDLHVAHFFNPEIKLGNKSFSLPLSVFQTVGSVTDKKGYKLKIEESYVYVYNDDLEMTVPITQSSGDHTIKMFNDYAKSLKDKNKRCVKVEKETLANALDNASSIYDNKTPLRISAGKNKVTLSVETSYGKVNETFKSETGDWPKDGIQCEAALITDLLGVIRPKEFTLNLEPEKCVYVKVKEGAARYTYVCVLI